MHFFPYNPRRLRMGLFAGMVASLALAAWALVNVRHGGALQEWARLGVAVGLIGAFAYMLWRTRAREGWGVKVDPLTITVSRTLSGAPMEIPWSALSEIRRQQKGGEKLILLTSPEGRVLLPRHLFANDEVFQQLVRAVEERMPVSAFDA